MSILNSIRFFLFKTLARQLRTPSGWLAKITGRKMNDANRSLYKLTLDSMQVNDGDHILEIGFGNGKYFPDLNAKAKNLRLTGIDLSPEMVREAMKINPALIESGIMKVKVGNSDQLPFDHHSFDQVFCINVIYFWENPGLHLKEIYRVLKPGGYFYTGFRPKHNMQQFPFTKFGFTMYRDDEWAQLLELNGFELMLSKHSIDAETVFNGSDIHTESLCIAGRKNFPQ